MLETIDISVFHDTEPEDNLLLVQDLEEEVISDTNLPLHPHHLLTMGCVYMCIYIDINMYWPTLILTQSFLIVAWLFIYSVFISRYFLHFIPLFNLIIPVFFCILITIMKCTCNAFKILKDIALIFSIFYIEKHKQCLKDNHQGIRTYKAIRNTVNISCIILPYTIQLT